MNAASRLLDCLVGVKPTGPGRWMARCPAHEDRRASLSVRALDDGRVLAHCFAGCEIGSVLAAVGLELADLYPGRSRDHAVPAHSRIPAADALRALLLEASVAHVAAGDLVAGRTLTALEHARLTLAVERLADAVRICNGRRA